MKIPSGLFIDNPANPLLQAGISYIGQTSAAGNAGGTTFVCADLANQPSYAGLPVKILTGPAAGQVRMIFTHAAGTETVLAAFTNSAGAAQQITAGIYFVIISLGGTAGGIPGAGGIIAAGTLTTSSATVPADAARTEGDNFFNGCLLLPLVGADFLQPRWIEDYTGIGGIFTVDTGNPFTAATGLVSYVILAAQKDFSPAVRALPGAGVTIARVTKYIAEVKPGFAVPITGTHNTASASPTEDTVLTTAAIGPGYLQALLYLSALVAGDDIWIRVYSFDNAAYQLLSEQHFMGAQTIKTYIIFGLPVDATHNIQIRTERVSAVNRAFKWTYTINQQPVA